MAFITKQDFTTHIYERNIDLISENDDRVLDEAIQAAMQKASRALGNYDAQAIFASTGTEREKFTELIMYIKDIAKYHFIGVCNVEIDYKVAEDRYNAAVKELAAISSGPIIKGWPIPAQQDSEPLFRSGSAPKFRHR